MLRPVRAPSPRDWRGGGTPGGRRPAPPGRPRADEEAAAVGTRKAISEHSTTGFVVATDGSITVLPRSA